MKKIHTHTEATVGRVCAHCTRPKQIAQGLAAFGMNLKMTHLRFIYKLKPHTTRSPAGGRERGKRVALLSREDIMAFVT